jgi:UDP-glucose-4-epimerase GalE
MTNVLVTGGAGYIGSHTAMTLAAHGFRPVVLDNLSTGHEWAVKWGPLVRGNIADEKLVKETIDRYRIDGVIHFAANAYVGESIQHPDKYFQNNVVNTLSLLKAVLDSGVPNLVFSSSCTTYGTPEAIPIDEAHPQAPVNPYGESKLFIERALGWYERAYGLRFVCLRYFNAAGADPGGQLGECHDPETHLIPLAIEAALGQGPPLKIFGTDYDTHDGTAVRDYVHVCDLAEAHAGALKYLAEGGRPDAFNLGTGTGCSVRDVIKSVEKVSGRCVPAENQTRRSGDLPVLIARADKARRVLGWHPGFTNIDEIVETAWRWHSAGKVSINAAV